MKRRGAITGHGAADAARVAAAATAGVTLPAGATLPGAEAAVAQADAAVVLRVIKAAATITVPVTVMIRIVPFSILCPFPRSEPCGPPGNRIACEIIKSQYTNPA
jgi:hypothetical protein